MKLEPEFSYTAELAEPQIVGPGPYGLRQVLAVSGGKVTGNRFSGTAAPGLTGGTTGTDFGDHYFVTTPRLESGDPRYSGPPEHLRRTGTHPTRTSRRVPSLPSHPMTGTSGVGNARPRAGRGRA
jgi:hypothetical protein